MNSKSWIWVGMMSLVGCAWCSAATIDSATITALTENKVKIRDTKDSQEQDAKENATVKGKQILRTLPQARAELEFNDRSIARLGANTVFSFTPQSRDFKFEKGVLLFQVPKGQGTTRIATPAATCAIVGTTVQLAKIGSIYKFMVLEGEMNITKNGKTYNLKAGEFLTFDEEQEELPQILPFLVGELLNDKGNLVNGFSHRKLPSLDLIAEVRETQRGYEIVKTVDDAVDITGDPDQKASGQEIVARPDAIVRREETIIPQPPVTTVITYGS
jgi:hypothetical protein